MKNNNFFLNIWRKNKKVSVTFTHIFHYIVKGSQFNSQTCSELFIVVYRTYHIRTKYQKYIIFGFPIKKKKRMELSLFYYNYTYTV